MNRFKLATFLISLYLAVFYSSANASTLKNIRDGAIYIRHLKQSNTEASLSLNWRDAWISESQVDHIYLLAPDGALINKYALDPQNTPGETNITLRETGDHKLEITGASFRYVSIENSNNLPLVFEPVKVHKSISLSRNGRLYFSVPANKEFTFAGKYYGGVSKFEIKAMSTKSKYKLKLRQHGYHWEHDRIDIPASTNDTIYEVSWSGSGKVGIWLDGIHNLFSLKPSHLFTPEYNPGKSLAKITSSIIGDTPAIGVAMPFIDPPPFTWPAINSWNAKSANHYFFADTLSKTPNHDINFLRRYEDQFNLKASNSILALTGRRAVLKPSNKTKRFLASYLRTRHSLGLLSNNYIALADEPNLNYPDFSSFESYYVELAKAIKQHQDPLINSTKLAVPQSSRFLNGPTSTGSLKRIGIKWAEKLVQKHPHLIDAVSWHEWMVRDLIDTTRYKQAVLQANELVEKYYHNSDSKPALIIGQTNISSGSTLSPYEQNEFFAALWWTSVVIQSSSPGKLDQLMWFKAADDEIYKKGLIYLQGNVVAHKPASLAMAFINQHLLNKVLTIEHDHPEIDVIATIDNDKSTLNLLGVNKSKRKQFFEACLFQDVKQLTISGLDKSGTPALDITLDKSKLSGVIPGETIFAVTMPISLTEVMK